MVDILISGGTVVTMDQEKRIINDGSIAINGNTIIDIGKEDEMKKKYHAEKTI
jgi:cytosine/adenosine deaminase-related metal-dependent hydrolase